jgi:hypothetical protein
MAFLALQVGNISKTRTNTTDAEKESIIGITDSVGFFLYFSASHFGIIV